MVLILHRFFSFPFHFSFPSFFFLAGAGGEQGEVAYIVSVCEFGAVACSPGVFFLFFPPGYIQ